MRPAYQLYCVAVAAARTPAFYAELGVPDTVDGRFDLVSLHVFLLLRRLTAAPAPGPALGQALFDAMFSDMDINLREMGVGDLGVPRRNRAMWEAFHGRSAAYAAALDAGDADALAVALTRNVWRGREAPGAARLAAHALFCDRALAAQPLDRLLAGEAHFEAFA